MLIVRRLVMAADSFASDLERDIFGITMDSTSDNMTKHIALKPTKVAKSIIDTDSFGLGPYLLEPGLLLRKKVKANKKKFTYGITDSSTTHPGQSISWSRLTVTARVGTIVVNK